MTMQCPQDKRKETTKQHKQSSYTQKRDSRLTTKPYVKCLSEKLKRIENKYNILSTFETTNTSTILSKTKPNNTQERLNNCSYKISCECHNFCVGGTATPLSVRINEHKTYIKNRDLDKSQICKHAWDNEHRPRWKDASIFMKETDMEKRKIKEAALILLNEEKCVANPSAECSRLWLPIKEVK
ncbi:uncharacterized protein LOC126893147 [Diabrotica virgifera virgifera]|uniref:GIY-YIG domain-containing protein n=1 Tax=Diabrotica virgifera virgifera TaxID=50390 RepID=A0ABM5L9D7_DIAVI|nr:uncharacterized protein LOC126893147 [Diabrotica virgifera virgifera]